MPNKNGEWTERENREQWEAERRYTNVGQDGKMGTGEGRQASIARSCGRL